MNFGDEARAMADAAPAKKDIGYWENYFLERGYEDLQYSIIECAKRGLRTGALVFDPAFYGNHFSQNERVILPTITTESDLISAGPGYDGYEMLLKECFILEKKRGFFSDSYTIELSPVGKKVCNYIINRAKRDKFSVSFCAKRRGTGASFKIGIPYQAKDIRGNSFMLAVEYKL